MDNLFANYINRRLLYENSVTQIYSCETIDGNLPRIIKISREEYPSIQQIASYRNEYRFIKNITSPYVIKTYGLESVGNRNCLILEDIQGKSLQTLYSKEHQVELSEFYKIAIKICEGLKAVHEHGIIHKDINARNIVYNPKTEKLKIIDFGLATEYQDLRVDQNKTEFEGSIQYIAPEQTGRVNLSIDYRADLYSLGILLYELATGELPFKSRSDLDLVHCHIARSPHPACDVNKRVPQSLSQIIDKLLKKDPDERYRSLDGLIADLRKSESLHKNSKYQETFSLAQDEVYSDFKISQKLYGKEKEAELLISSFEKIERGSFQIMFIKGRSGLGKTALVNEVLKPLSRSKGLFLSGKFDQFKKSIPFLAIRQSLKALSKSWSSLSYDDLESLKQKLNKKLGDNAQIISKIIPELEFVLGQNSESIDADDKKMEVRLLHAFVEFFRIIAKKSHPIVLYIDDLQWADNATINVLRELTTICPKYLMIISSYREQGIEENFAARDFVENASNYDYANFCQLRGMNAKEVFALLNDSIKFSSKEFEGLADYIFQRTDGNPFYVIEYLKTLHAENILKYDTDNNVWNVSLTKAQQIEESESIVDFMLNKLKQLKDDGLNALSHASVIGNSFGLKQISAVLSIDSIESFKLLKPSIDMGFIAPANDDYKYLDLDNSVNKNESLNPTFKFRHDRIQQAAYSLLTKDQKAAAHATIGNWCLRTYSREKIRNNIIEVTRHLNFTDLSSISKSKKRLLAFLNYLSAVKSKQSVAYGVAIEFLEYAIQILSEYPNDYNKLNWHCRFLLGQCTQLDNQPISASKQFKDLINHTSAAKDKASIYLYLSFIARTSGQFNQSIDCSIEALRLMGVKIKPKPGLVRSLISFLTVAFRYQRLGSEKLLELPENHDEASIFANECLYGLLMQAFLNGNIPLYLHSLSVFLRRILKYGITKGSSYGVGGLAVLLATVQQFNSSRKFADACLELADRFNDKDNIAGLSFCIAVFVSTWNKCGFEFREEFKKVVETCYVSGDTFFLAHSLADSYFADYTLSLSEFEELQTKSVNAIDKDQSQAVKIQAQAMLNFAKFMQGEIDETDEFFDFTRIRNSDTQVMVTKQYKTGLVIYQHYRLKCCYYSGDYETAYALSKDIYRNIEAISGLPWISEIVLFSFLTHVKLYKTKNFKDKFIMRIKIKAELHMMKKWFLNYPKEFSTYYNLMLAEYAIFKNKPIQAMKFFENSITTSKELGYFEYVYLISSQALNLYRGLGNQSASNYFIKEKAYWASRWGLNSANQSFAGNHTIQTSMERPSINSKITQMSSISQIYSTSKRSISTKQKVSSTQSLSKHTLSFSEHLDIETLLKTTQSIAQELNSDKLLMTILDLTLKNSGAQKGILFLEDGESLEPVLMQTSQSLKTKEQLKSSSFNRSENYPERAVMHCLRTKESLVINSPEENEFLDDLYFTSDTAKSVACIPLKHKEQVNGVIYLENKYVKNTFGEERIKLINAIATQASISIENKRLISNIKRDAKLKHEIETAEILQECLLPTEQDIPGVNIASYYKAAENVGGDWFYHYYDCDSKNVFLFCGDVTGHGISSALVTGVVCGAISMALKSKSELPESKSLEVILERIATHTNAIIRETGAKVGRGMTMLLVGFNLESGRLAYVNAGHNYPYILNAETASTKVLTELHTPFGHRENENYKATSIQLKTYDRLFLFTDGLIENISHINQKPVRKKQILKSIQNEKEFKDIKFKLRNLVTTNFSAKVVEDDITYLMVEWIGLDAVDQKAPLANLGKVS